MFLLSASVDEFSLVDCCCVVNEIFSRGKCLTRDEKKVSDNFLHFMRNGWDKGLRRVMFSLDGIIRDRFTLNGLLPCSVSIPHMKGNLANGAVRLP